MQLYLVISRSMRQLLRVLIPAWSSVQVLVGLLLLWLMLHLLLQDVGLMLP